MRLCTSILTGSVFRCLLTFWMATFLLPHAALATSAEASVATESLDAWLRRISTASEGVNFEGTFVVGSGNQGSSSHIVHFGNGKSQLERVERLDGPERVVYRRDDEVVTQWPAERVLSMESRRGGRRFPFIPRDGVERITDRYRLAELGSTRIAGRAVRVFGLVPNDAYRYGYRLWIDTVTGLPLRAEILGSQQQVLEWAAFSDISFDIKADPQRVLQGMTPIKGWIVRQPELADADLVYEGWTLSELPPGFRLIRTVKRKALPVTSMSADTSERGQPVAPVLQLIFSDGLTYVSLFVEPYEPSVKRQGMLVSLGATQTLTVRRDSWWFTAMGDVPAGTLKVFIGALQHRK